MFNLNSRMTRADTECERKYKKEIEDEADEMIEEKPIGHCAMYFIKKETFDLSKKGRFDISAVKATKTQEQVVHPGAQSHPFSQSSQSHLSSVKAHSYISPLLHSLIFYSYSDQRQTQ